MDTKACLNLVFLNTKGAEETASGNQSKKSCVAVQTFTVDDVPVTVYDTPGISDTTLSEEETQKILEKVLQECQSGPCAFLLFINADRFTEEESKTVEKIEELLGENRLKKTWILFTNGEQLEKGNMTIQEFINETESLKKLIQKYNQRYYVFKNKTKEHNEAQFKILLSKMIQTYVCLKASEGGILLRWIPAINSDPDDQHTLAVSLLSRRIVLLGKTGVGKSAAGNTILGQKEFKSVRRMNSVTSESSVKQTTVSGRSVSVVDTPGFFDTQMNPEELAMEIARSVYISSPGPHAFLIVLRVDDRFTEQEQQIPQMIEIMFGQDVLKFSIILFTHGDQLEGESVEELIKENCKLRHLVQQCGERFHVFNNKDENNREQVNDLLKKIDSMIEQNGGGHYSNQMYEDAHRFRREEEERQREEEKRRKLQVMTERLEDMMILQILRNTEFDQFYRNYQHRFRYTAYLMSELKNMSLGAVVGGTLGGILGVIAGPAGVVAGAMAGATAGAAIGKALSK